MKADWLGTLGHEEGHGSEIPGFPFLSHISLIFGSEKASNPNTKGTHKSSNKNLLLLAKKTVKVKSSKTENF